MAGLDLELPIIQNWSCHNCSGCCRQHVIEITDEEKQRIEAQGWGSDPDTIGRPVVLSSGGVHRLAHQADGACVFLDDQGLCRIHARFGEPAKPLACRVYPYAFHPAGRDVTVSLRFSCPSVVNNRGTPVSEQAGGLRKIARLVVPADAQDLAPPKVLQQHTLPWGDFLQFVDMFDAVVAEPVPVLVSLLRLLLLAEQIEHSSFQSLTGESLTEYLQVMAQVAVAGIDQPPEPVRPRSIARRHLRMLAAQYARKDTLADVDAGLLGYWNRLRVSMSFVLGYGRIRSVGDFSPKAKFAELEEPLEVRGAAAIEEILIRYFRVKIQGIHFCGRAYYDVPLVEGIRSLILVYPTVMWTARALAIHDERDSINEDDVSRALAMADHNHGFSEALGQRASRFRVRILARMRQIAPLCVWYSPRA